MNAPTTSDLRQATIAAITAAALADSDARVVLTAALATREYRDHSDNELFDLAYAVGVPADKIARLATLPAGRRPDNESTYLCVQCLDNGWWDRDGTGRYDRCLNCNPIKEPDHDRT